MHQMVGCCKMSLRCFFVFRQSDVTVSEQRCDKNGEEVERDLDYNFLSKELRNRNVFPKIVEISFCSVNL